MTVLLRLYLKLDSQAFTLSVQTPVLFVTRDGHTVTSQWSLYIVCRF